MPDDAAARHRLPPRYRECFSAEDAAEHDRLMSGLTSSDPVRVLSRIADDGRAECTVLAFDHPSLFSLISGILSSLGFDVSSGDAFTEIRGDREAEEARAPASRRASLRRPRRRPLLPRDPRRRHIVDRFVGTVTSPLEKSRWQALLESSLRSVFLGLEEASAEALRRAKSRVNGLVADALASLSLDVSRGLYPVEISIDNAREGSTVMEVVSEDTPFFLYAFSSALSLRGLSIEFVRIRTEGSRIRDEFGIVDAAGRKLADPGLLDQIRLSALLTKQFSYFLAGAPDPTAALQRFEELVERAFLPAERERWTRYLSDPLALQDLARLLGASDFLWEDFIRRQYESLLPILRSRQEGRPIAEPPETLEERLDAAIRSAVGHEAAVDALNVFKDAEIFAYDLDHILDPAVGHAELSRRLTRLAECVVRMAARLALGRLAERHGVPRTVAGLAVPFAIMGLGKLGGEALGYASDIELLFVYQDSGSTDGGEPVDNGEFFCAAVRELAKSIRTKREGIFSVDLRLRPYGSSGPAACSLESFCRYYGRDGDAHASERLALVSMRRIGGDAAFGARLERVRDELVYVSGSVDLGAFRALRARQAEERDAVRRSNAKFSPGALVDLEYAVQILQVKEGGRHGSLRTPKIREALAALGEAGVLDRSEAERLVSVYGFLRGLINALRMLRGSAMDLFLPSPDSEEYAHLARRMGYQAGLDPARRLHLDFETQTAEVRSFLERHFGSQSLLSADVGSCADLVLREEASPALRARVLAAAGIRDVERGYRNLRALAGSGGARRLFARVAVLAADMLPRKPDADMALNNWERFMARVRDRELSYERLLRQPTRLDILLSIFASSQHLADTLIADPELFEWLAEPLASGRIRRRDELRSELEAFPGTAGTASQRSAALRSFKRREIARIGTKDICLGGNLEEVCLEISELADALVSRTFTWVGARAEGRMAVLAFGKLGGRELNYSSDIDLVGVYEALGAESAGRYSATIEALGRELGSHTEAGYVYRVDLRLRPWGASGELAVSRKAFLDYYERVASLWELQAALKARPVAGDEELGRLVVDSLRLTIRRRMQLLFEEAGGAARLVSGMRRMRGLAAKGRGRLARLAFDVKNDPGGIRDVEFVVQLLELSACRDSPELLEGNTLTALELLRRSGDLGEADAGGLRSAYLFLRKVEHYLQIYDDRQTHTLPTSEHRLEHLARCLLGPGATGEVILAKLADTASRVGASIDRLMGEVERR